MEQVNLKAKLKDLQDAETAIFKFPTCVKQLVPLCGDLVWVLIENLCSRFGLDLSKTTGPVNSTFSLFSPIAIFKLYFGF